MIPEAIPIGYTPRQALIIRDAIFDRVSALEGMFKTFRKTGEPPLLPEQLPACSIFYMGEDSVSWGDPNVGMLKYQTDCVIGISVTRGFNDPVQLEGGLANDIVVIKNLLLTDGTFTKRALPEDGGLFESVPRHRVDMIFPQTGEAYFAELRLALTFRFHPTYPVPVKDRFEELDVRVYLGQGVTPIEEVIVIPQRKSQT
jgi:hypothetical protein